MSNALYQPQVGGTRLRRAEQRFNYQMEISVRTKFERFTGTTIDVSSKGMKFSTTEKMIKTRDSNIPGCWVKAFLI